MASSLPPVKTSWIMKTGERVKQALARLEVSQSEVGRRCGVTPQSVGRWIRGLDDDSITDDQWSEFAKGLRAVGLRPEDFRPLPAAKTALRTELVPLLNLFTSAEQLRAIVTILTSEDEARGPLLLIAQERLRHMK